MWYYLIVRRLMNMVLVFMVWIVFWADVSLLVFFAMLSVCVESPEQGVIFLFGGGHNCRKKRGENWGSPPSWQQGRTTKVESLVELWLWKTRCWPSATRLCHITSLWNPLEKTWRITENWRLIFIILMHEWILNYRY